MQINELLATTVALPLDVEHVIASRVIKAREYTLVKVKGSGKSEGVGFCYSGSRAGHISTIAVKDLLQDHVLGKDSDQVEQIWDAMYRDSLLHGRRGSIVRAISAIDMAIWDLRCKEKGVTLYALLGAKEKTTTQAYASGGAYVHGQTPDDLAKELAGWVRMGFRAVKIKVGRASPEEDVLRIRACRKNIGYDVQIFLDANNGWPDAATAIKAVRMFEEFQPGWIEEPLMPDDVLGLAEVAANVAVPVATGEIDATRWGFEDIVIHKAAKILQPDVTACGGISEWIKIAVMAGKNNIPVAPHAFADVHAQLVAATPNATWVEFFPENKDFGRVLRRPIQARNGEVILPHEPGVGLDFDEKAIEQYSKDGWH